ncbi:MAG: AEC family transporter [Candidatus Margulisbacteria bacterium]|nr:AEC family transporter [Candidatus Margulisiibacteriota bacterium]
MELLASLAILLFLISLGFLSRYYNIFKKGQISTLTSFIYYFGLPALFIVRISKLDITLINPIVFVGSIAPILIISAFIYLFYILKIIKHEAAILLGLSIVFGSNAFFGLAFFEFFKEGAYFDHAIATASALGALGIILSLFLFELTQKKAHFKAALSKLTRNPLIIAIAIGFTLSTFGINKFFILKSLEMLGNAAPGIAVFCLGIFFYDNFSIKLITKSYHLAIFRQISLPLGFFIFVFICNKLTSDCISFNNYQFLLLQTGIPSAVSLAIFANKYKFKVQEITGLIIITSFLSFLFLGLLYLISLG